MARIYRLMKIDGEFPKVGDAAMCLGLRPGEVPVDQDGNIHPQTGGLSVYSSMRVIPARMVPKRLQPRVPGAAGNNNLAIWALGSGPFASGPIDDRLTLRIDPDDPEHGFIEPNAIMSIEDYERALIATRAAWLIDEH